MKAENFNGYYKNSFSMLRHQLEIGQKGKTCNWNFLNKLRKYDEFINQDFKIDDFDKYFKQLEMFNLHRVTIQLPNPKTLNDFISDYTRLEPLVIWNHEVLMDLKWNEETEKHVNNF